jgi:serine/threonine protein kinase
VLTLTAPEARALTPDYASPEQINGERITTATDVYSLGVLLYELLTGTKPYRLKTHTADEMSRAIREQEPERPSTAVARADKSRTANRGPGILSGDLDTIVLAAMRKEPQRRYPSVAGTGRRHPALPASSASRRTAGQCALSHPQVRAAE